MRELILKSAVVFLCCGLAMAQSASERLLATLPERSLKELFDALGPPPSLDELLDERPTTEQTIAFLSPESAEQLGADWERVLNSWKQGLLSDARQLTTEYIEKRSSLTAHDDPKLAEARILLRSIQSLSALDDAHRQAALASQRRLLAAIQDTRGTGDTEPLADALLVYLDSFEISTSAALNALGSLGVLWYQAGEPSRADRVATLVAHETLASLGPRHPSTLTALSNLAFFRTAARANRDAETLYSHLLQLRRSVSGDNKLSYARVLFNVAQLFRDGGRAGDALKLLDRVLEIRIEHGANGVEVGMTHAQLGNVYRQQSQFDEARGEFEAALEWLDQALPQDHIERAQTLQLLSLLERDTGRYEEATQYGTQAVAMYSRLFPAGHVSTGHALLTLAATLLRRGELDHAEERVRAASAMFLKVLPAGHAYELEARATLGTIMRMKGDLAQAHGVIESNLTARRRVFGARSRVIADGLSQLAQISFQMGDVDQALANTAEEIEIVTERLGEEHSRTVTAVLRYARLLMEAERYDEAWQALDRARSSFEDGAGFESKRIAPGTHARAAWLEGRLCLQEDDGPGAREAFENALEWLRASDDKHPFVAEVELDLGEVLLAEGNVQGATQAFQRALAVADGLRTHILGDELNRATYADRLSLPRAARALARSRAAADDPQGALSASEQGRGRSLLDLLSRSGRNLVDQARAKNPQAHAQLAKLLDTEAQARNRLFEAEQDLRRETSEALEKGTASRARTDAQLKRVEQRQDHLQLASAAVRRNLTGVFPAASPATPGKILASLRPGEGLLYFIFDVHAVVLVSTLGEEPLAVQTLVQGPARVAELLEQLKRFGHCLQSGETVDPELRRAISKALLPPSIATGLSTTRRVVVIPDGPLHAIPFETLDLNGEPWLTAGPVTTYSASGSVLARRHAPGTIDADDERRALVLGDPQFEIGATASTDTSRKGSELDAYRLFGKGLEPLPGTGAEAKQVAQLLSKAGLDVTLLRSKQASQEQLEAHAPGVFVLHIATHGFRAPADRPYETALALAAPNKTNARTDGFLTLDELIRGWGGILTNCDLVTLSACDTNRGTVVGESVVSLPWGFFHAGAQSVLVSLWKVDDHATLLFMDHFYRLWADPSVSKATALAQARSWLASRTPAQNRARLEQLGLAATEVSFRSGADDGGFPLPGQDPVSRPLRDPFDFQHPRYWAAFVLFGSPD